jgi:hypothetical protein
MAKKTQAERRQDAIEKALDLLAPYCTATVIVMDLPSENAHDDEAAWTWEYRGHEPTALGLIDMLYTDKRQTVAGDSDDEE